MYHANTVDTGGGDGEMYESLEGFAGGQHAGLIDRLIRCRSRCESCREFGRESGFDVERITAIALVDNHKGDADSLGHIVNLGMVQQVKLQSGKLGNFETQDLGSLGRRWLCSSNRQGHGHTQLLKLGGSSRGRLRIRVAHQYRLVLRYRLLTQISLGSAVLFIGFT